MRPVYRALFDGPLTEINNRLQNVERISAQLHDAEANLAAQLHKLRAELVPYLQRAEASQTDLSNRLRTVDANFAGRRREIEANRENDTNGAEHWNAIEQLILALLRLPESREVRPDVATSGPPEAQPDLNGLHATSTLR